MTAIAARELLFEALRVPDGGGAGEALLAIGGADMAAHLARLSIVPRRVASWTATDQRFEAIAGLIAPRGMIALIDDPPRSTWPSSSPGPSASTGSSCSPVPPWAWPT